MIYEPKKEVDRIEAIQYKGFLPDLESFLELPIEEFYSFDVNGVNNVTFVVQVGIDKQELISLVEGDYVTIDALKHTDTIKVIPKEEFEDKYQKSPYYDLYNNLKKRKKKIWDQIGYFNSKRLEIHKSNPTSDELGLIDLQLSHLNQEISILKSLV